MKTILRGQALFFTLMLAAVSLIITGVAQGQQPSGCKSLPGHDALRSALQAAVKGGTEANGGLGNQEWGVILDRNGIVCAVAYSGENASQEWPGSRMIAADKANTANGFSGPDFALSTANVYWPSQPGQSLYGIITSQPPNPQAAFGDPATFGTANDPMVGKQVGGVVVFGGGLALYSGKGKIVGGLGLSGDTSCADHVMAWKVRHQLGLDAVPYGVSSSHDDNMIEDIKNGQSASGYGHPQCKPPSPMIQDLPKKYPVKR
jgi:uncharacterized protein GlcG (DUF336 family)